MKNIESIEMAYNRKYERAIQDGLKTRLVKTTCDCCKKPVVLRPFQPDLQLT